MRALALFAALSILSAAPSLAQQNVGIALTNVISSTLAVNCGFDCNNPNNTGRVTGTVGQTFDVRLYGDAGLPGVVAIGLGPVSLACPGVVLPGIQNGLMINPGALLATATTPGLAPGLRTCSASGSVIAVSLNIPAVASGLVLTVQGLVFDAAQPTFTRAVDLTVR